MINIVVVDARFDRVDNGFVEWFDMDLPEVIGLTSKLLINMETRYHLISSSVFDYSWVNILDNYTQRPVLFIAEGVFIYFEENQNIN